MCAVSEFLTGYSITMLSALRVIQNWPIAKNETKFCDTLFAMNSLRSYCTFWMKFFQFWY